MKLVSLSTVVARRVVISILGAFVLAAMVPQAAFAQINPADVGTRKLNLAKSKYSPNTPPKSLTYKSEAVGQGMRSTFEGINAEGKPIKQVYMLIYDGKPQPAIGVSGVDSISITRIDSYKTAFTLTNAGKVVRTRSLDGKSTTISGKGVDDNGQQVDNVAVYEKQ